MIMSHAKGTGSIDVHRYWPYEAPVPKYWCPVHGRIRESATKRENGIVGCTLCNTLLLSYPTVFKPSKPGTVEIDVRPVILGQTPRLRSQERTTQGPSYYPHKLSSSSNEKTTLDEDSVLLNLIKIVVYLFVDLFLLALLLKLLT